MTNNKLRMSLKDAILNVSKNSEECLWQFLEDIFDDFGLDQWKMNQEGIVNQNRIKVYPIYTWICTDALAGFCAIYFDDKPVGEISRPGRKSNWQLSFISNEIAGELYKYLSSFIKPENQKEPYLLKDEELINVYHEDGRISIDLPDEKIKHIEYTNTATIRLSKNDVSKIDEVLKGNINEFFYVTVSFDSYELSSCMFGIFTQNPNKLTCLLFIGGNKEIDIKVSDTFPQKISYKDLTLNIEVVEEGVNFINWKKTL